MFLFHTPADRVGSPSFFRKSGSDDPLFYVFYDLDIKESLYSFLQFSDTILSGFCRLFLQLFLQLTLQNILTEILLHLCQILEFTGIQAVRLMRSLL